jgi:hypothetical protein
MRSDMLTPKIVAVAALVALLPIPAALAQADQSGAPLGHPSNPRDCMPSAGNNDPSPGDPKHNPPLSAQASPSAGVICPPPGIDPEISVPPTGGGNTPVIPPPGTPGGDPTIQPK